MTMDKFANCSFKYFLAVLTVNLTCVVAADFDEARVNIGGKTINLPQVAGFPRLDGKSQELDKSVELMASGTRNRVVALYGPESDLGLILKGQKPTLTRTITIQSVIPNEQKEMPKDFFPRYKIEAKKLIEAGDKSLESLLEKLEVSTSDAVTRHDKVSTAVQYGRVVPLGIYDETVQSLSHSMIAKAQAKTNTKTTDIVQVSSISLVYLDGKLLTIYASSLYDSIEDLKWTRKMALAFRDKLIDINSSTQEPPTQKNDVSYTEIELPNQMSISIPSNWWIIGKDLNTTINARAEAVLRLSDISMPEGKKTTIIRTNSMPRSTYASVSVQATDLSITPQEYNDISSSELQELNIFCNENIKKALTADGLSLLEPSKTTKEDINGLPCLTTKYRKEGMKGAVNVELISLYLKDKQFDITLAYRESESIFWQPIVRYIRSTIKQRKPN